MSGICSFCDKITVLICPECGWEVCKEHSRKDGRCFYCTHEKGTINQEAVDFIKSWEKS